MGIKGNVPVSKLEKIELLKAAVEVISGIRPAVGGVMFLHIVVRTLTGIAR